MMTSLLFCTSLVLHEVAHSVIAKHYKIPVVAITLFVFGGVPRIGREPGRAIEEFNIAVAGPLSSLFLAGQMRGRLLRTITPSTLIFSYGFLLSSTKSGC